MSLSQEGCGGHVSLSGCACVCSWTYVLAWEGGRQWYITHQQALSLLHLSEAKIRPRTHTQTPTQRHECALLSYPSQSASLLCWHATGSPPNSSTRASLCYCLWGGLGQVRKRPVYDSGMMGVKCKWLWSLWQSALFVDDWVEIRGEETRSESLVINEIFLMDTQAPHKHTGKKKKRDTHSWTDTFICNTDAVFIKMPTNRLVLSSPLPRIPNQLKLVPPQKLGKLKQDVPHFRAVLSNSKLITRTPIYILCRCEGERWGTC